MQQITHDDIRHDATRSALALGALTGAAASQRLGAVVDPDDTVDGFAQLLGSAASVAGPERMLHLDIARTAAALGDALERAIRPRGLTGAQYNVLRILRDAEPTGLCRNALRERLPTRMPDVTRLLDRLEAAGLVTRQRDPQDRRLVTTCITPEGRRTADELDAEVRAEHQRRLGFLEPAQAQTLTELLALVRSSIEPIAARSRR
jgi:DNA-binding MarR family transcriptional regulator